MENLLREDELRPWLGCPHDRSRQLRLELQLERASLIGYVDIGMCVCPSPGQLDSGQQPQASRSSCWDTGNCGCAFLQIEVGRSSWPLEQPYLTLVPSVALMTPADAKLERNRCGVRMFKEGKDCPIWRGKSSRAAQGSGGAGCAMRWHMAEGWDGMGCCGTGGGLWGWLGDWWWDGMGLGDCGGGWGWDGVEGLAGGCGR